MKWKIVQERNALVRRTMIVEADTQEDAEDIAYNGDYLSIEDEIIRLDTPGFESFTKIA